MRFCDNRQLAPLAQRRDGCCGDNKAAPHPKDAPGSLGSGSHTQLGRDGHAIHNHPQLRLRNQASSGGSKKFARADGKLSGRLKLMLLGKNLGDLVFQEALK